MPPGTTFQVSRSMDRGSSDCFLGSWFLILGLQLPHPSEHYLKAVTFTILVSNTLGGPSAYGIDDVSRTLSSPQPISKTMPERVGDASVRNTRLQPLVQCCTCRVSTTLSLVAVFREGKLVGLINHSLCCPERSANQWNLP